MNCPLCSSSNIRRSSSSDWMDVLPKLRGREAFRCRKCRHRFFATPSGHTAANDSDRPRRKIQRDQLSKLRTKRRLFRRAIAFGVIVVTFSLFGLFLHYITADHVPKEGAQDMGSPNE